MVGGIVESDTTSCPLLADLANSFEVGEKELPPPTTVDVTEKSWMWPDMVQADVQETTFQSDRFKYISRGGVES
jgi:hypothetical protein